MIEDTAKDDGLSRRSVLGLAAGLVLASGTASRAAMETPRWKGRLKHSVCRWCYGRMPLEELCAQAKAMGLASVELLGPDEWPVAKAHGLTCAVATNVKSNPIPRGFNRVEHHDAIVRDLEERLPMVAAAGLPCQIVFSGNRAGLDDAEAIRNCVAGLKRIAPLAERLGVTLVMELLNSKDHGDYHCDRTPWGVEVVKGVGSDRFKLLYDIYHMQRMEGDVIATIRENLAHIAHFHTGGVPGRAEIDQTQELNYATICKAIADAGYTGYIGQEFIPRGDPMASLRKAVELCDQ
ncbi:MAG: hydroxypyruvate isomerase [Phycisphaerae bacterium]|nr:MAG: hydroxypyruvate isomerase [Phycisphaerae bacterium]